MQRTFVPCFLMALLAGAALCGPETATAQHAGCSRAHAANAAARDRDPGPAQRPGMDEVSISGPTSFEEQAFDVLHYDVWLDLTAAPAKTARGVCEIRLRWSGPPTSGPFFFHLRDLTIDSIFYNGAPATAASVGDATSATYHFRLAPPPTARQGDTAVVRIVYGGEMTDEYGSGTWGGVSSGGGTLYALGVGFLNNYVSSTEHWMPCYDHPSDKATFRGRFTVKQGRAVASNGLLVAATPGPDSTVVYDWRHDFPCATYLLTFAVDNYVALDIPGGTKPMVVYARPQDTAATRVTFKLLGRMVRGFADRFGEYPFEKVGYVNTPVGAMEHQTMISFPTSLSRSRDTVNSTGAHELAHQWFGDLVSPQDYRHAWLNESFATYCESVWAEELGGYAGYLKSQEGKANQYMNSIARSEGLLPLYDFPRTPPSSNYPTTIYEKGAVVVGMLRFELGDSLFHLGIRDYLAQYAYGVATTENLRAVLEARAGRSLEQFFDQWVYRRGFPTVDVRTSAVAIGGGYNRVGIQLAQTQSDTLPTFRHLPVELGFRHASGETTYRLLWMDTREQAYVLDSIRDFASVTVNRGPSVRALLRSTVSASDVEGIESADSAGIEFIVRPNPLSSANAFTVEVHGAADCAGIGYELYDAAGHRLLVGRSDSCQFPIPSSGFNSGVYVLRFRFRDLLYDVPLMIAR